MITEPLASMMGHEMARAMSDLAAALRRSTVEVRDHGRGAGSGLIWSNDGLIVTNAHVARASRATVNLSDGRSFDGVVTARDPRRDLATIAIDVRDDSLPAATLGHPTDLRAGDLVVALGHPLGITGALAVGVVHTVEARGGAPRWIRADIRLAPGNSGGPLADARGRVVGINTLIANGLGVAVPVTTVHRFLDAVRAGQGSGSRAA